MYSFEQIEGNEFIKNSIKKSIRFHKISHSYIFDGPSLSGKKLLAMSFAKTLLCEEKGEHACGHCISCRSFEAFNNPDVCFVRPAKSSAIGVDDIREQVISTIAVKPYKYRYKIYIIDKADKMTVQAQNALLKTIEEPPEYGIFLLISNNLGSFLETILSRCVVYKLKPIGRKRIEDYLVKNGVDQNIAGVCASYSQGAIGQALKLAKDDEFNDFRKEIIDIIMSLEERSVKSVFKSVKAFEKYKENIDEAFNILYLWYRDALIYKSTLKEGFLFEADKLKDIAGFSKNKSLNMLLSGIEAVSEAKTYTKYNSNFTMTIEVMFMKLAGF